MYDTGTMIKRKTLVKLAQHFLLGKAVTERTLRFYEYQGLLDKPKKRGREVWYDNVHLKQLIVIRTLQDRGVELTRIKRHLSSWKTEEGTQEQVLMDLGYNPDLITEMTKRNDESESVTEEPNATPMIKEKAMSNTVESYEPNESDQPIGVSISNKVLYDPIRKYLKLGSCFAFINGIDPQDPLAKKIHAILHGQMSGSGTISKAVIPVDDVIELPGCSLTAPRTNVKELAFIITDKDVYKEGEDTARLFVFNPNTANKTVSLTARADGVILEQMNVQIDENGCGFCLLATHAPGSYMVTIDTWNDVSCSFDVVKYELAPLLVTLTKMKKSKDNIEICLSANSFGAPFQGMTDISVNEGVDIVANCSATFDKDGNAEFTLYNLKDRTSALSLTVSVTDDSSLIASVPLQGTSKKDREETTVAELGKNMSVSLLGGHNSVEYRGLYFSESGFSNTPISLKSCISDEAVLEFYENATDVVVLERSLIGKKQKVHKLGDVKAKDILTITPESTVATLHIGAFVEDIPWEGHSVIVKPSKMRISIKANSEAKPGDTLDVVIKAPIGSSVLLTVRDKRLKPSREPLVATASRLKEWLVESFIGKWTGRSGVNPPDSIRGFYDTHGGPLHISLMEPRSLTRAYTSTSARNHPSADATVLSVSDKFHSMSYSYTPSMTTFYSSSEVRVKSADLSCLGTIGAYETLRGYNRPSGYSSIKRNVHARESHADILFCELLKGNKKISIRLPDIIGEYEIVAFGVELSDNKFEWAETRSNISVSKDSYIEPMIPMAAHPDDQVTARAVIVGIPDDATVSVVVNCEPVEFEKEKRGNNLFLSWVAMPGIHEVTFISDQGCDKVIRVVEEPGTETVLSQELRILLPHERYDVEDGVFSVKVMPGMQEEVKKAVQVCTDFSHSCSEQTSAKIVAAVASLYFGDDGDKDKANTSIVKGYARMKSMYIEGKGFASYPDSEIYQTWSALAARRLSRLPSEVPGALTSSLDCLKKLRIMGEAVNKIHGPDGLITTPMEKHYYDFSTPSKSEVNEVLQRLNQANMWDCVSVSEAAFCAAALLRVNQIDTSIRIANEVSKKIGPRLGGAMHGTCETLAYMAMVLELQRLGVVSGTDASEIIVDGKTMTIEKAMNDDVSEYVCAENSAIAIKLTKLERIDLEKRNSGLQFSLKLIDRDGDKDIMPNRPLKLEVKLNEKYSYGDVLCVSLPSCLSRIMGGAVVKKFQVDFAGKDTVQVDLVSHDVVKKPQHWAAIVRNMYDGSRIGSMGIMKIVVSDKNDEHVTEVSKTKKNSKKVS